MRAIGYLLILFVFICYPIACTVTVHYADQIDSIAINNAGDTIPTELWNKFLQCSKDEGDLGCDSCYRLYIDPTWEGY